MNEKILPISYAARQTTSDVVKRTSPVESNSRLFTWRPHLKLEGLMREKGLIFPRPFSASWRIPPKADKQDKCQGKEILEMYLYLARQYGLFLNNHDCSFGEELKKTSQQPVLESFQFFLLLQQEKFLPLRPFLQ